MTKRLIKTCLGVKKLTYANIFNQTVVSPSKVVEIKIWVTASQLQKLKKQTKFKTFYVSDSLSFYELSEPRDKILKHLR